MTGVSAPGAPPAVRAPPPRLYLITDRHACRGRPLAQVVARALDGTRAFAAAAGAAPRVAVQLREKDLGGRELTALARELREITRAAGAALYVNDRVDVAIAIAADGVHLPRAGFTTADVRRRFRGLAIGVSTHSPAEVAAAADAGADFAVFGPVFPPLSKPAGRSVAGLAGLSAAAAVARGLALLALGGVTPAAAAAALGAGATGVASIAAVLSSDCPERQIELFLECILKNDRMVSG